MPSSPATFIHRFTVLPDAIDANGHVNNVVYVQRMQDVAIRHSESVGGLDAARAAGGSWVVRAHHIEYLNPAFAGDDIEAHTWIVDFQKVRSTRRYTFTRANDGKPIARGETEWVFIDAQTGRPRAIPESVIACYTPDPVAPPRSDP